MGTTYQLFKKRLGWMDGVWSVVTVTLLHKVYVYRSGKREGKGDGREV